MTQTVFASLFEEIYSSFMNLVVLADKERPLHLAHYTSLEVLEKIIQSNEIWFSNPLFMNDRDEMRFALGAGTKLLAELGQDSEMLTTIGGTENFAAISNSFHRAFQDFDVQHSLDVYVFCLSEYDATSQPGGRLSMWRGYGANGQGAALVFNTQFATAVPGSPLLIAKVEYASTADRVERLKTKFRRCLEIFSQAPVSHETRFLTGYIMFQFTLFYSLLSKHVGFEEEQEWRVIYFPDRDKHDLMKSQRTYLRRNNTIEPKLRFPIEPLNLEPRQTWTFDSILERIVLGPTHATNLALNSARRMLVSLGKPDFAGKIWVSEIPYRPIGN
jgi:hypothetical protein